MENHETVIARIEGQHGCISELSMNDNASVNPPRTALISYRTLVRTSIGRHEVEPKAATVRYVTWNILIINLRTKNLFSSYKLE